MREYIDATVPEMAFGEVRLKKADQQLSPLPCARATHAFTAYHTVRESSSPWGSLASSAGAYAREVLGGIITFWCSHLSVALHAQYWDTCEYQDGVLNYNQDGHRQRTVNWCDTTGGTAAAFDFTTKGAALHI